MNTSRVRWVTLALLASLAVYVLSRLEVTNSIEHFIPSEDGAELVELSLELVHRLRSAGTDIVRRIDDHQWMRMEANRDREGWLGRIAQLFRGHQGGAS